jgi:hypothetical protein
VQGSTGSQKRPSGSGQRNAAGKRGTAVRDGAVVAGGTCGDNRRRGAGAEDTGGGEALRDGDGPKAREAREKLEFGLKLRALYQRFDAEARELAREVCRNRRHASPLLEHTVNFLLTTTLKGSQGRTYAWCHWCLWRYKQGVPSLRQTLEDWPPNCVDWQDYELYTRNRTRSNQRHESGLG